MATVASPVPSPSRPSRSRSPTKHEFFPTATAFPSSPSLTDLKPNAHPYPIATTATGVLSRSNSLSSPSGAVGGRHHYVPVPPSPSASPTHNKHNNNPGRDGGGGAGKDRERRTEYRGHRYSRSLSSSEDMYSTSNSGEGQQRAYGESRGGSGDGKDGGAYTGNVLGPRALPVPPGVSANSIAAQNAAKKGGYSVYAAANAGTSPKRWTPAQLAAHLNLAISPEAGAWAERRNVGGKAFMRMREEELEAMGAPPSLRPAARALRQEVLQLQHQLASSPISSSSDLSEHSDDGSLLSSSPTRIDEGEEQGVDDEAEDGTPQHDRRRTMSVPSPAHFPFALKQFAPAPGSPFASLSNASGASPYADFSPTGGRFRNGRVRGMVRSFESSGSEAEEGGSSPEREKGMGSGFRNVNGGGSGFRAANGSGFRRGMGDGNGGSQSQSQSESGEDELGGTVRPQRALPVRPDGVEGVLDLGATVRGPDASPLHGRTSPTHSSGTHTRVPVGDYANANANAGHTSGVGEDEMTVEELLALEGDAPEQGVLSPAHTGGGAGSWRRNRRRGRGAGVEGDEEQHQQQRTGEHLLSPQRTGSGGGSRPLPAHPSPLSYTAAARSSSGGVHAWEADEEPVGGDGQIDSPPRLNVKAQDNAKEQQAAAARERARAALVAEAEAQERGRARGAAVRAQLEETASLRKLVDAFRARAGGGGEAPAARSPTSVVQRLDPRRLLALFAAPGQRKRSGEESSGNGNNNFVGPTTLGALPSYVLLVSLGMCAVVLRVLVKKSLGAVRRGAATTRAMSSPFLILPAPSSLAHAHPSPVLPILILSYLLYDHRYDHAYYALYYTINDDEL
ncbi:hypothetical protein C8F04DRAFT_1367754 [Mycena alexandri]|uniref:Uncharacterized protein n=1 Tax=Mycena alexandri TaxID=1745969 RepID=A0AAD6SR46_9AGAR|nr:hypothetical protein C8F04DRAFT_1367754 [Mycena alexandri]